MLQSLECSVNCRLLHDIMSTSVSCCITGRVGFGGLIGFSDVIGRWGLVISGLIDDAGRRVDVSGISAIIIATEFGFSVATGKENKNEFVNFRVDQQLQSLLTLALCRFQFTSGMRSRIVS